MSARRTVRVTAAFFADLDAQLGSERGPNGEPSTADFQVFDLLDVVEDVATRWDDLPPVTPDDPTARVLIRAGKLVPYMAVVGRLAPDGAVELTQLDIDSSG